MLIASVCGDPTMAAVLSIIKNGLKIIQVIVPIILIISGIIQFTKMTINPDDDKKGLKKFINSVLAAIIVFMLPVIVNLTMQAISSAGNVGITNKGKTTTLSIPDCWIEVDNEKDKMDSSKNKSSSTLTKEQQKNKVKIK